MSRIRWNKTKLTRGRVFGSATDADVNNDAISILQVRGDDTFSSEFLLKLSDFISLVSGEVSITSAGGDETLIASSGGGAFTLKGLTAGTGVSVTGGASAITLANTKYLSSGSYDSGTNQLTLTLADASTVVTTLTGISDGVVDGFSYAAGVLTLTRTGALPNLTANISALISGYTLQTRNINTSGGLTGGGNLSADRTLSIATNGVTTAKINAAAVTSAKVDTTVLVTNADRTLLNNFHLQIGTTNYGRLEHNGTLLTLTLSGGAFSVVGSGGTGLSVTATGSGLLAHQGVTKATASATGLTLTADSTNGLDAAPVQQAITRASSSEPELEYEIIDIGDWDMDASATVSVAHGLSSAQVQNIRSMSVMIRDDGANFVKVLGGYDDSGTDILNGGVVTVNTTNVILRRLTGGNFDSTDYDSTSYNRGWIKIEYVPV